MIATSENVPLDTHTTFKVGGPAKFFVTVNSVDELREAVEWAEEKGVKIFVLGGGSNILVSDAGFDGLVIKMNICGVEVGEVNARGEVLVRVGAGENWDEFVADMVSRGFGGLENLSYIPGTVGAAPVQNIGAYGVEVSQILTEENAIEVFSISQKKPVTFSKIECQFSYRDSVFKKKSSEFIITHVHFMLTKNAPVNISYKDLAAYFANKPAPTIAEVRDAVIAIRTAKLPDWKKIGTAGSFFKNPIVSDVQFVQLKEKYPAIQGFPVGGGKTKVLLAWILDNVCGFRGVTRGPVGVYQNQALVIVNTGSAKAVEVKNLATEMAQSVKEKTGIDIEPEVQYLG